MKIPGNFFLLRMQCQRHIFTSNEGIKRNGLNTNIKSLLVGHMSITVMCYWNQNKLLFASCSFFSCSYILSFLFTDYFWYCEILPSLLFVWPIKWIFTTSSCPVHHIGHTISLFLSAIYIPLPKSMSSRITTGKKKTKTKKNQQNKVKNETNHGQFGKFLSLIIKTASSFLLAIPSPPPRPSQYIL